MVRAAALALVVQRLRSADDLRPLRDRLGAVWRRGVTVGALARAVAQRTRVAPADSGLLTGLLHVVGRLYVLARMHAMPHLFEQEGIPESLLDRWSDEVTGVLLLKWEVPREFCEAIERCRRGAEETGTRTEGPADLADVLMASQLLADLMPPSRADYLDQMQPGPGVPAARAAAHPAGTWTGNPAVTQFTLRSRKCSSCGRCSAPRGPGGTDPARLRGAPESRRMVPE